MSTVLCRWLFLLLFLTTWTSSNSKEIRVVCYYTNWSVYRPGTAKFSPQNINPYLCTHLVYAFGGFTKENTLKPFDKYQDIEKGGYAKFTGLKTYNKNLKTLLAIGGWNEGSSRFSPMVANPERRKELVKNAVKFLRQNHFDGLDLDWEYPSFRDGGKSRDRDNYAQLVQELREEFERESDKTGRTRLLLTMAVPAGIEYINKGYDIPKLTEYLDWMNILSYDYHSAFEPAVNHHAPLYSLEEASEYNYDTELNIDYTIKHYLKLGADPNKLVMGIPTYGRSYTLFNPDANEIGAPADGPGDMGDATRENGYLAYYEICENIKSQDWEVVQPNPDAMGPYAYKDNQWVGYDDDAIARKKAAYVAENGLGGIMFWSIDNDDFRGNCHGKPYPIIEAAKEALISAYGLTDDNLISPPTKPSKTKTRTRTSTSSKSSNNDNKDEVKRKNVTSGSTRRRNRVKTKSNENNSSRPKIRRKESRRSTEAPAYSSLELVTPSYTTPAPPPTPDQGGVFKCEDEGFYPHPKDCKKYFWCLSGPGELGIIAHQFTCPAGLYFNKAADSCDYTRNVLCNKKLSKSTTTTTTTTTEASTLKTSTARVPPRITAATSRTTIFRTTTTTEPYDDDYEYEDDEDDDDVEENKNAEEDPRVIKELLDLIKKAGGIEELEKQLKIHENGSASVSALDATTPSSISKSLVERVLGKTKNNIGRRKPGYTIFNKNSRGPQNKGLEKKEEKHDRSRPQYTTITRQRPQKSEVEIEDDEVDEVESPRKFTKKFPEYVNIRRGRVSSTTEEPEEKGQLDRNKILGENDNDPVDDDDDDEDDDDDDDETEEEKEGEIRRRKNTTPQYVNIRRQRPSTTEETSTSKYTILRRGSTTEADLEDASENSKSRRRGTTTPSSDEISSEGKRQGTTASSNTDLRSKYKILRRGSTTESTVKETTPSTVEDDAIQSKSRRRGSTTPSTQEVSDVKTRGTIISSITTVLDDQNFTDSSTVKYSTPPQVTLTTHSSEDITTLQSDSENPITTEKLLLTTPESLSSLSTISSLTEQPNISLNLSDKTADGTETTISEKQPPLLLEPRPFSLSTSSPTTSLKPVTESSTRITKVSESNYKLRVRQKIPNTQTDIISTTTLTTEKSTAFRTRAPSRFRQTTSNNLDNRTLKPTQNASVRSKKRFSTTTEAYADNYEEYDLNRTYRPSDFADLSSLTAVDFAAVKGLNRFSSSSRQRRPRPTTTTSATTTTTTKKPEEGLKTSSRTLPLARKLLDGASFGKSRRVIPTKKEPVLDDQINSSSDTTHRIRSFTRAPSRFSTEKPPSDTGRIRNRKIIRRFRPTSTSTTTEVSIDNDSKKLSQDSATEIENFVESASTNPLFTRRFTRFPSTTSDSTTKLLRLSSTLPPREDDEQNETSDDVSIEEGENIKLSESNIRENSNVNNDNVLTYDGKKVRRRVLKRIRSKVDGKNDDFVDDVNEEKTSTEPNIIIRTRKIIRKLQSTESSLPIISTTEATDVSTIGRRRKIIRRLRPTSAPSEIIPLSSDSPVPTTAKTLYIRGRPFIPHLTTEANVDTSTETLFGKKEYKTISRAPLFESATEDKEFAFEKNKFENLKPLFKSKYKTILRNTSPQPEGGTLKTPEDHSQRTIDRSKYKTINRGITSTKSATTEVDIDDNSEEQEENEEIISQSILRNTSPQPEGGTLKTPEDHSERTIDRSKYKTINRGTISTKLPTTEVDIDDNSEGQEENEELTSQSILRNTSPQPEGGTSKTPEDHSQRSIIKSKYKTINRGTISTKLPTTEVDIDDNSEEQEENEEITSQSTPKYRIYQPSNSDDQNEGDLTTKSPKYRIFRPILTNKSTDDEANAKTRILRPSSEEETNESVTDNIQNIQNEDDTPENVAEDYQVNDKTKNDQAIKMEDSDKENENKNEQNSTVDENIYGKDEPVKQENNNEANENKNKQNNNDNENVNENDQPIKEEINEEKDGSEELITTTEEVSTEETTGEPTTSEEPHTTIRYVNPILDRQKNRPVYRRPPKITTQNPLRTTPVNKPKYKSFSRTPTISHRINLPSEKPVENKNEEIVRKFVPKSLSRSRYNRINNTEATVSTESILSVSTASEINNTDINITDKINSTEPTPLTTGSPLIVSTDTSTVTDNITGTEIYNIIESTTFDNLGSTEIVELTTLPLNNDGSTISSEMTFEVTSTPTDIINITTVNITDEINSTTESTTEQLNLNSLVLDLKDLMNDTILQENETVNNKTEVSETTTFVASSTISNEITEDTRSETTLNNEFSSSTTNTDTSTTETTSAYYPKSTLQSLQNRPTYNVPKRFSDASTSVPKTLKRFSPRGRGYSATSSPKLLTSTSRFTTPSSSIRNKFTYKYSTTEKNQFLPNEQEREDEDVEDYEEKVPEEVEEAKEEESEEQTYLSSILSSTTARTRSKPRISNRPSGGYTFIKSTETPKATEDLSDINKEAVKNRNKNLFSKKRKMNTPYAGTPVATSSTTTEERTTEGLTTIEEKITVENATETITVTTPTITELVTKPTTTQEFETTEYLTTLHHIFAETEPIVDKMAPTEETTTASLNDTTTTMSSKVEKLIEVNRIVEVHEMNKSDNFDKDTKVIDKVGVINRVTVVKVVDGNPNPEENEINETTSESTTTATTTKPEVTLNINGAYIIPEIAKVQEVKAPDITSERQDRKYEVYGDIKVVDYSKKESNDKPAIIDGASNINIITPRPFHSTEASTISLEALFQTDTPQKLNNINANLLKPSGDYELLETGNSRYVNIRILGQDNEKAEIADDTQIVPIKVLKQDDDYITMKAQVVEVTPKTHKQTIKIVPIQVEMSRRIIGPSDFNTKLEGDVPKSGRVTTPFLFRVGGRRKTSPALATTTTTSTPEPSSRPTKITRRKHPPHTIKPLLESQDSTTKSLKVTDNRYKFVSRKPNIRTSTPKTKTKTQEPPDQTKESSNQQSLEENFEDENETTELGDIALALHQIQQAPVPSKPRTTTKTPVRRVTSTRTPTRSRIKYSTTASTLPLTTKKFIVRKVKPQAFEKINPSISNTFRPLSEYDYYDDDQMSILGKIPEHSKVLLHSNGVIECLDQGNFPHPVSCKKFISCAKMENGKVLGWEYTCPKNLSFDPIGGICNWSAGLGCNEAGT